MIGGRLDVSYITMRVAHIRTLMNQCMELLEPYYQDPDTVELTDANKLLIDQNDMLINRMMDEIAQEMRRLVRGPESSFRHSTLYKQLKRAQKMYLALYAELYGGYKLYDVDMGIEEHVRAFHHVINSI